VLAIRDDIDAEELRQRARRESDGRGRRDATAVWWQRGQTPRGRRDIGYRSAWIIGAVCQRATLAWRWS
jgi:hypothetical protein